MLKGTFGMRKQQPNYLAKPASPCHKTNGIEVAIQTAISSKSYKKAKIILKGKHTLLNLKLK